MTNRLHNKKELEVFRKKLRNNLTLEEAILWNQLKNKSLGGYKFRRQHSVGNYIVDFYCPKVKVRIELDGMHHFTEEGLESDKNRDQFLDQQGIQIIRIENSGIWDQLSVALELIKDECDKRNSN